MSTSESGARRSAAERPGWASAAALFTLLAATAAGEPLAVLDGQAAGGPADRMMVRFLLDQIARQTTRHREEMLARRDPEGIRRWQTEMRNWFEAAIGGLPDRDTPLQARVTGTVEQDGYRVEKVLLESQPGVYVTAALFLPDAARHQGPYSAVLIACGHSAGGKAEDEYQRGAALLALEGIAALLFDPIDQGERHQLRNQQGRPLVQGTEAHNLLGVGSILLGTNPSRFMIHDARRCLDYLESRPDIDGDRLAMAGNSGGGTQTTHVMGIEDRLRAAAPACFITDFGHWLALVEKRGDVPGDAEQNVAGQLAAGLDHWGFLTLRAPMPVLVCAATRDFFPIAGTRRSVEVARAVFERLGHPDRIDLVETDAEHGWQQPLREATATWMLHWLCDQNRAVREPRGLRVLSDREIRVTPTGEVLDLAGARSTYDLNAELMTRLRKERQAAWAARGRGAMLGEVRRVTGIRPLAELPAAEPRHVGSEQRPGYRIDRLVIEPEPGIVLPAVAFVPPGDVTAVTLWLDDRGKAHPEAVAAIERRVAAGEAVLAVDLRGLGETRSRDNPWYNPRNGRDAATVALAWMLGRSTVAMRAEDVLVVARVARGLASAGPPVNLVARGGQAAVPALHAAALERGVFGTVDLAGGPESFEEIVAAPLASDQFVHTVHAALTVYDLPLLRQALTFLE